MNEEIIKRPFIRPLFLLMTGIMLYALLPYQLLAILTVAMFLSLLSVMILAILFSGGEAVYEYRWVWGAFFSLSLIIIAITICHLRGELATEDIGLLPSFKSAAADVQLNLVDRIGELNLADKEKSLLATLTLGYRQALGHEARESFSLAGVSHVLAVSGFHVAVLSAIISTLCSFMPRQGALSLFRYSIQIMALWIFVFITGLAPSAVRAAVMITIYIVGRAIHRRSDGYNTLAASAFCMLVYNPAYLFDIGFQLSYMAVLSILFVMPRLQSMVDVRNPLLAIPFSWLLISIAAQVGTALLCFYYFGRFSLVFLFTNPPVSLISTILIPLALLWMIYPSGWFGCDYIKIAVERLVNSLSDVVDIFARMPFASVEFGFGLMELLLGYAIIALLLLYAKFHLPKLLLSALTLLLFLSLRILISLYS